MSSGATSAWKLYPDGVEDADPTQARSTFPAFTSSSVPASYSGSPSRQASLNSIARPARKPSDLVRPAAERIGRRAVVRVRQGEDARLRLLGSTGLVAARAAARGQGIADTASTAAIAHRMNRLGCIVVHLR